MALFHRRRRDEELIEELELHVELDIEDNIRDGMTLAEARRQALIKLGGFQQTLEGCRDTCSVRWIERLADRATSLLHIDA